MKEFLKPTKAKVLLTIALLVLSSLLMVYFLSFFGSDLMNMCLPNIPDRPLPTPEPLSISRTIADLKLNEGDYPCLRNDPSAQVAFSIQHITEFILFVIPPYLISCTYIFFGAKLKRQKKNIAKLKK